MGAGYSCAHSRTTNTGQLLDPEQGNASGAEPDQSLEAEPHHPTGPLDETSVERWIESALNLLLGSSRAVDGAMKGPTAMAAARKKAPDSPRPRLTVDGVAGPMTIGALEKLVDAQAPDKTEAQLKAGSGKKEGEADAPAQNDAHPASTAKEDEGSEAQVEQELPQGGDCQHSGQEEEGQRPGHR